MRDPTALLGARLASELQETIEAIQQAGRAAATVELDQSSIGRVSRMDALQQQALAKRLLEQLLLRQRKIEAALARINAGSYGLCCACEGDLEPERLGADPAAVFCMACAAERERPE
ncbi:TraR/DksA family transcriptional regulator [Accumulibacter sp.]|uniref:TraR/DksA family transcriptional regulator n=1 Tax=Accumulibacter sp. TaxID=2053492 RepID=UPI0028C4EB58|nr:TraR/DksA C4-type zinc finger protein [Accumulibacter sp.]